MTYKVIQWTTGVLGRSALRLVLDRDDFELVGVKCFGSRKEGRDAGDIVHRDPVGVTATANEDALLAVDADCVIFTPNDETMQDPTVPGSLSRDHFETALRILRSGKNVVSSLCPPTHYKHLQNPAQFVDEVEAACEIGQSSIHYTGVDPGFFTDAFVISLASGVGLIDRIRTWEVLDYNTAPYAHSLGVLGFGRTLDEMSGEAKTQWIRETWGGVPHVLAAAFGQELDRIDVEVDYWISPESYVTAGGMKIESGTIGGYMFNLFGVIGAEVVFTTSHVNRMGPHVAPQWPQIGHDGGYRIEIDGSTPLSVDIPLGNAGGFGNACGDAGEITAARLVNCIEPVVLATPGYKTILDLGMVRSRLRA